MLSRTSADLLTFDGETLVSQDVPSLTYVTSELERELYLKAGFVSPQSSSSPRFLRSQPNPEFEPMFPSSSAAVSSSHVVCVVPQLAVVVSRRLLPGNAFGAERWMRLPFAVRDLTATHWPRVFLLSNSICCATVVLCGKRIVLADTWTPGFPVHLTEDARSFAFVDTATGMLRLHPLPTDYEDRIGWSPVAHSEYPAPFRSVVAVLARGMYAADSPLHGLPLELLERIMRIYEGLHDE